MRPVARGLCTVRGERVVNPFLASGDQGEARCGVCQRFQPTYDESMAYESYDGRLREHLPLLKYHKIRPAASLLGRMIAEIIVALRSTLNESQILVIPARLHSSMKREREFNQSEQIARAAVKQSGMGDRFKLNADLPERCRLTQSQIGLSRHQRRENMHGAFIVVKPGEVSGREVLLIDDVFTTGTAVSECARILRRAGASKVFVATAASTLKNETAHVESSLEVESRMAMAAG
jgi:predicted amidophosphoribosyltransferase